MFINAALYGIAIICIASGFGRGLIRQTLHLIGLLGGLYCAYLFFPTILPLFQKLNLQPKTLWQMQIMLVVTMLCFAVFIFVCLLPFQWLLKKIHVNFIDRLLGSVVGILIATIWGGFWLWILVHQPYFQAAWLLDDSQLANYLLYYFEQIPWPLELKNV
jgi:uncharacterized membrane protein required for colicin V production